MSYFDFEKLDVYQASIEVITLIDKITDAFPRGRAYLTDQLQRAGSSISLNIAEGSGESIPQPSGSVHVTLIYDNPAFDGNFRAIC